MPTAELITGTVYAGGTVTLLARVVGNDAAPITQSDIATITYSVYEVDPTGSVAVLPGDSPTRTVVAGHNGASITVADAVFDAMQTDDLWTEDATGYNFRHTIAIDSNAAFSNAGYSYVVLVTLTPATGQAIVIGYELKAV